MDSVPQKMVRREQKNVYIAMEKVMLDSILLGNNSIGIILVAIAVLLVIILLVLDLFSDIVNYFKKEGFYFVHYVISAKDGQHVYNSSYLQFKKSRYFNVNIASEVLTKSHDSISVLIIDYKSVSKKEYDYNVEN